MHAHRLFLWGTHDGHPGVTRRSDRQGNVRMAGTNDLLSLVIAPTNTLTEPEGQTLHCRRTAGTLRAHVSEATQRRRREEASSMRMQQHNITI